MGRPQGGVAWAEFDSPILLTVFSLLLMGLAVNSYQCIVAGTSQLISCKITSTEILFDLYSKSDFHPLPSRDYSPGRVNHKGHTATHTPQGDRIKERRK